MDGAAREASAPSAPSTTDQTSDRGSDMYNGRHSPDDDDDDDDRSAASTGVKSGDGKPGKGSKKDDDDEGRCHVCCCCCCCCCCREADNDDDVSRCSTAGVCGSVCTKTFLITVNFAFFVVGWLMLSGGVWIHIYHDSIYYTVLLKDNPTSPLIVLDRVAIALIATGAAVSMIGFLGCCGACTESVCFLGFYATLLILFIVTQVIVVVLFSNFQHMLEVNLAKSMKYQIHYEYNSTSPHHDARMVDYLYKLTSAWDSLQTKLECCGAVGPADYQRSAWYNHTQDSASENFVPISCCRHSAETEFSGSNSDSDSLQEYQPQPIGSLCQLDAMKIVVEQREANVLQFGPVGKHPLELENVHAQGCHAAVVGLLKGHLPLLTLLVFLDILQVINLFYACVLIGIVRKKHSDYSWCEDDERI